MVEIVVSKSPSYPQPPFQPVQSFRQKLIDVAITLAPNAVASGQPNTFAGTNSNTVTLSGYRTRARISGSGGVATARAQIEVYGVSPDLMNQLLQAGPIFNQIQGNSVLVSAGDAVAGMTPVFGGTIMFCQGLYDRQPDVSLQMICQAGGLWQVLGVPPSSYSGATDVATIVHGLANAAQMEFENNGVTAQLANPYYAGNLKQQLEKIAHDAHIVAEFVDNDTKIAIWPVGGSRTSLKTIPLISAQTGMIGYPTFGQKSYMLVKMLYNPQVSFGGQIQVESDIPQANGTWTVYGLDLALDSKVPHGEWATTAMCFKADFPNPPPP